MLCEGWGSCVCVLKQKREDGRNNTKVRVIRDVLLCTDSPDKPKVELKNYGISLSKSSGPKQIVMKLPRPNLLKSRVLGLREPNYRVMT